jgi:hypothetical protein
MSLRTLMQAGPTKVNELFARLSETSDGAVKTREKLYAELKAELELHTNLEEQHLFPVLRRHAETKELVTEAIKDNRALRAKLAELDVQPKSDEAFPERLRELQRLFRQHARDEKRELLPAVQRALNEEQVQTITQKIEAGVAEAEKAKHDEAEARRARVRQEREEAERQAELQAAAERAREAAIEQARRQEAEQKQAQLRQERAEAERQAAQEIAARQAEEAAKRRAQEAAAVAARAATAMPMQAFRMAETAAAHAQRVGAELRSITDLYVDAARRVVPNVQEAASLPRVAVSALTEIRSTWIEWMGRTTLTGAQVSQDLLRQAIEQQQRFAADAVQGWMEQSARVMQITMRAAQQTFSPLAGRSTPGPDIRRTDQ